MSQQQSDPHFIVEAIITVLLGGSDTCPSPSSLSREIGGRSKRLGYHGSARLYIPGPQSVRHRSPTKMHKLHSAHVRSHDALGTASSRGSPSLATGTLVTACGCGTSSAMSIQRPHLPTKLLIYCPYANARCMLKIVIQSSLQHLVGLREDIAMARHLKMESELAEYSHRRSTTGPYADNLDIDILIVGAGFGTTAFPM